MLEIIQLSSLEKVLPKSECSAVPIGEIEILGGERFTFQIAYKASYTEKYSFTIESDITEHLKIYDVGNMAVQLTTSPEGMNDANYICHEAAVLPDRLIPNKSGILTANIYYKSLWIESDLAVPAGKHKIKVKFKEFKDNGSKALPDPTVLTSVMEVNVMNAVLPHQELLCTQWLYADCIKGYYGFEDDSEELWSMIEKYIKTAVDYGINMILTPLFNLPLDTTIGGRRPVSFQLIDVYCENGGYTFGFEKLRRWIRMCLSCGIEYFEMCHMFSQWGAKYAPHIENTVNGKKQTMFGWKVAATDDSYKLFLKKMIPCLLSVLKEEGVFEKTFFHISDEPNDEQLEGYFAAKKIIEPLIEGRPIIDALSHYEYYEKGITEFPIVSISAMKSFVERGVKQCGVYYCSGDVLGVSNRLISMPSCRNRFIGFQIFKFGVKLFLHWGYNFYYSQLSKRLINPFCENDADGAFPAGDAFSVYPESYGPEHSLRMTVFAEALQDLRAAKLLESKIGHDAVVKLLEEEYGREITCNICVDDPQVLLNMRKRINERLSVVI